MKTLFFLFFISVLVCFSGCSKSERYLKGAAVATSIGAGLSVLNNHCSRNNDRKRKLAAFGRLDGRCMSYVETK